MMRRILLGVGLLASLMFLAAACGGEEEEQPPAVTAPAATEAVTATETVTGTVTAPEQPPSREEVATALRTAKTKLQETIDRARAGDLTGTKEAFEVADEEGLHTLLDGLAPVDASLADTIEEKEEEIEDELDLASPDLGTIADIAEEMLPLLDQAAQVLGISA